MYVPDRYRLDDQAAAFALIRQYNFGLLVTAAGKAPVATHLPFLLDETEGPNGTLIAHMARANPQWKDFAAITEAGNQAIAIFQGPHAYVSPNWYGKTDNVPTWNYLAVHVYGVPRPVVDPAEARRRMDRLVAAHEAGLPTPWSTDRVPASFADAMMRGIVVFDLPIERIEAVAKLNQNKTATERRGVIEVLQDSDDHLANLVAERMSDLDS